MTITAKIKIKPLDWSQEDGNYYAEGPDADYCIRPVDDEFWLESRKSRVGWKTLGKLSDLDTAQACANIAVEEFVRSWIE